MQGQASAPDPGVSPRRSSAPTLDRPAGSPPPVLHVLPAHAPDGDLPDGAVVDKRHSRVVLAFTPDEKGTR